MDTGYRYNIGYKYGIPEINLSHIVCQSTWFLKITRKEGGRRFKKLFLKFKIFGPVRPKN